MKGKLDHSKIPGFKPPNERCCLTCDKPMKPMIDWQDVPQDSVGENIVVRHVRKIRPVAVIQYGYDDIFCSLTCGYRYARRILKERGETP